MNQIVHRQNLPRKPLPPKRQRIDNEFLPAALEILETPASPIRTAFIWFICALAFGTLLWSYLGTFDIVSAAQGKIQPAGRVKVVQSLEVGKTKAVPVVNGSRVKAGEVLVELDDTELKADEDGLAINLQAFRGEIVRREAVLATVAEWRKQGIWDSLRQMPDALLTFAEGTPASVRKREQSIYTADLSQLSANLNNLAAQRAQQQATIDRLGATITAQRILVATLKERVTMRSSLVDEDAGSRSGVIDALETSQKEEATLAEDIGQLAEAQASYAVATSDGEKTAEAFVADNVEKAGDASRQADGLEQQLLKARKRRESMIITSPIDGTVQASAISTVGQVVNEGAELMRVVPDNSLLEIEAYLPNSDIGFVSVGQPAVIKMEAFPFTRYGVINGHVMEVATDAIPEPDANQLESDPAKELQGIIPTTNAQRVQNLVFPVTIKLDSGTVNVDGKDVPLSPGMAATVEIKTGKRRILEYLFSPLAEVTSQAMHER
ncbi:HlyD family type I secretion periplasmic adaptor subunit [Rhizobium rhizogenes]|uniref:HlyD family type I secretion periplasmic adaptor subunit n=1 Tax=Rhizobium rhizogenes TaxID=359 RepID=UPI000645D73D|nr:HlyD family type I secretion periplasmic adaptor subunit [Rhizobium rhizogenes]NTG84520.1 HlyD family type I secretion periplasmic adaptor subunit [Rhizobium rhizogenes]NTH75510.1 HlyD family type I secretion periplasmic adaptor subunit [Rhizobium rhizogenes]NTH81515.1 HlyD family type I secretion periplasmic adaptor subunit [Rhizobium rhizogenes]NTI39740.1 HlyD family type I secretion periplasmic adaptor subunit [Rhizobium rhizogenes]WEO64739.1 HlyD family type I secretion periplasmic adap